MSNSEVARHRAEANFKKKELQVLERAEAMADYEAAGRAVEKKTASLKALRLAKEERGRQAAAAKKSGPRAADRTDTRRTSDLRRLAKCGFP